jgi:hypothetical protein
MAPNLWTRTKEDGWELTVNAESIPEALRALSIDLSETMTNDSGLLPRAFLQQAKKMLERFPQEYIDMVAGTYFCPDNLLEYEDDMLNRGNLTAAYVRSLDAGQLEALADEMQRKIRLDSITFEFRPEERPFANQSLVWDCGYVVDPLARQWQTSVTGNFIEGWYDAAD